MQRTLSDPGEALHTPSPRPRRTTAEARYKNRPLHKGVLAALLLLIPYLVGFGPPSLVESDDVRLPITRAELRLLNASRPPQKVGRAALILDLASGRVVFHRGAQERHAPASLTKIMTAVLALEQGKLGDTVTILPEDLVEGSSMGLQAGDNVTLEQLLWGLLLPSGNDAAQAIARYMGNGSPGRFVEMMNEKARTLQLYDTHFVNAHGLDGEGHYSTAYDLAQLGRYALRDPLFARMVSTRERTIEADRTYTLRNTNQLLFTPAQVPGVNGVKTGFTDLAGHSIITSVEREMRPLLTVVLGAEDRTAAATKLIDYGYTHFTWVTLPLPLVLRTTAEGALAPLVRAEAMLPSWQRHYVNFSVEMGASVTESPASSPVGLITYYLAGMELGRLPLYRDGRLRHRKPRVQPCGPHHLLSRGHGARPAASLPPATPLVSAL